MKEVDMDKLLKVLPKEQRPCIEDLVNRLDKTQQTIYVLQMKQLDLRFAINDELRKDLSQKEMEPIREALQL